MSMNCFNFFVILKKKNIFAQKFFEIMEKMLFEFDYKGYTIYCVVDFYDSFVKDCRAVNVDFLWRDYSRSINLLFSLDSIEDVHLFQSLIYNKITNCIQSFLNESVVFKRNWNLYCDSVPRVYQFEKESLFMDSKIKKFRR